MRLIAALVSDVLIPVSIVHSCVYRMVCGCLFADTLKDKYFLSLLGEMLWDP